MENCAQPLVLHKTVENFFGEKKMDDNKLKQFCLSLMSESKTAILSTIDKLGFPNTRCMLNLRNTSQYPSLVPVFDKHQDDFLIYMTTSTKSDKVSQIKNNPKVSVYYNKPEKFQGAMFSGNAAIIEEPEIKKLLWQDGWEMYYPDGYDDPGHTVLRLIPVVARGWHGTGPFRLDIKE